MPKYKTKKARTAQRRRKATMQTVPRDKRILYRWARRGSINDYEKLNKLANRKLLEALVGGRKHFEGYREGGARRHEPAHPQAATAKAR